MQTISVEAKRPWKIFAGILQWTGLTVIIACLVNIFAPFGFPSWAFYIGGVLFFIGMLGGMKLTWFRQHR